MLQVWYYEGFTSEYRSYGVCGDVHLSIALFVRKRASVRTLKVSRLTSSIEKEPIAAALDPESPS